MTEVLTSIHSPKELKALPQKSLPSLAQAIRQKIIDVMSINGGHLGSNMGIVELTIALHRVFDSPTDKFIFDVSHQTYPHKLLTGRQKEFHTIRKYEGLSGFSSPEESPHDHFFAGHAGTALSLGLGVAKNRDLAGRHEHILPIIGDATLTCGLSLEALNNLPKNLKRFIIVLNDNNMSISNNVGAITQILSKLPGLSPRQKTFFEQYGLNYIGPVDGHDVHKLVEVFEAAKNADRPTLVHVLTTKGKGLANAEIDPICWHGCSPFDKVTGDFLSKPTGTSNFPKVFGQHLLKMAENDPSLVAITPAMPVGSKITEFMEKFPDRCIDVGIAEGHAVTYSGGISYGKKMKVVCSIYATFLQRAFDNLFQDVCLQGLPVVFALDRGGIATGDGPTHHGIYDISFLNAMPNMVICQPRNGQLLKELLESAFTYERPTAIRYPNMATEEGTDPLQKRELGKGEILKEGKEIALIALGHMTEVALEVRELLAAEGLQVTVVDPIFVKPLDTDLLADILMSHTFVATIEEHAVNAGLGLIFNSFAMRNGFQNVHVRNFGIPETFLDHGSHGALLKKIGLDAPSIARQILKDYAESVYDHCHLSQ
jgi:1-deoxy-D-xylulose-5-phosphate synthase